MNNYYAITMDNLEEHLKNKSGHNTISRNLSGSSSTGFLCEVLTGDKSYFIKIRVDEKIEFVIMEVFPGINVPAPYRAMASQFCMQKNSEKKVGNLVVDPTHGNIHCHVEASFKDAPLTGETLEEMEHIAITFLMSCQDELESISHGLYVPQEEKKKDLSTLLDQLRRKHREDDEDDEDNDSPSSHLPSLGELFGNMPDFPLTGTDDE